MRYFPIRYRWGNNIPSLTPPGKRYDPVWSPEEVTQLVEVLTAGIDMFRSCTCQAADLQSLV